MEEKFRAAADAAALGMEIVATLIVVVGAAAALLRLLHWAVRMNRMTDDRMETWRRFGLSLLLGLEFMLAADIVRTAISPSWRQIGELAAIAAIRTFLSYYLESDLERQRAPARGRPAGVLDSAA